MPTWLMLLIATACGLIVANLYYVQPLVGPIRAAIGLPAGAAGKPRALVFFSPWCETYLRETRPATAQACRRVREDATRLMKRGGVDWLAVAAPLW
ncbi:hypothetical protein ACEN88_11815, partial [Massilia sp. CT11-108]